MNGWNVSNKILEESHASNEDRRKKCWCKTKSGGSQVGGLYPRPEDGSEHQAGAATESMELNAKCRCRVFCLKNQIKSVANGIKCVFLSIGLCLSLSPLSQFVMMVLFST